ncbi:3-hydroxyacyl-CoA dehydrogenase NAD-binding domain-containing protein [Streptomyces sp. NPDC002896]|uniref:3-hydroxyacyl-CoA dehydrogenase NAD-binding domain-containing protein n=1 Tax=Streptomyces sp. NPDC002896 TaxID=3154438 RepID=UPI0033252222
MPETTAATTAEAVRYDVDRDGIATLTLDLPGQSTNVLGAVLQPALAAAVERALADPAVTTGMVLTSAKSTFTAGGDLKVLGDGEAPRRAPSPAEQLEQVLTLSRDLRRLETGGKPVVCAINGTALGGGFEIALACHRRIVADDPAIMLGLPEVGVGLLPAGGGTQRLPRLIGIRAAVPILLSGAPMSPAKALAAGLVDAVVPADRLLEEAKQALRDGTVAATAPWDHPGWRIPGGAGALEKDVRTFFGATNTMTRANTSGNLPAPAAVLAAVYEGTQLPMDAALRIEGKRFLPLLNGQVSQALIRTMFINKGKADKLHARPEGIERARYHRVGILGAGTMGAGVALVAAKAGLEVVLLDRDQAAADEGKAYGAGRLRRDVDKGRTTREKADTVLARIHPTAAYEDLADVPVVIEAVFEDPAVKADVIRRAEAVIPESALFATNTSALPITGLAQHSARPGEFIGMHFFSPAERMPLVEIIRGGQTSDAALAHALDLARTLRKTPIVVNDSPGFFTSRFIGSFVAESLTMISEGVNPSLVENGARALGMPMGAMAISDSMGLDLAYHAARSHAAERGEAAPDTSVIGKLVAEHGRHGRKNSKGFYDYAPDGSKTLWPGLAGILPSMPDQPTAGDVRERILYAQLAEAARAFAEGVLPHAIDGDLGATLGVGFPAHLGGPYTAMDDIGIPAVVAVCDRLATAHGAHFAIPDLLRDMATTHATFHGPRAVRSPAATAA